MVADAGGVDAAAARRAVARRAAAARARSERAVPTTGAEVPVGTATRVDTVYQLRRDTVYRVYAGVAPASPAADQFEQARRAAAQRGATSLGAATQLQEVVVTGAGAVPARSVGGRTFTLVDGRWTDTRYASSMRVTKIKAYSKAYFALLDQGPELREMLALGERVLIAGTTSALEVGGEGSEELSGAEAQRLLKDLGIKS